jgi:ABC-type branched-subunit amino acid transport system permease subunit
MPLLVLAAVSALAMPFVLGVYPLHVLTLIFVSIISAIGLNFVAGLSGQVSLCHATFSGIAAYLLVILGRDLGMSFWLAWPLGALVAAGVGYLVGIPALRLQGHYLALATLGFGEIILLTSVHWERVTNGPNGLDVPAPRFMRFALSSETAKYFLVLVTAAALLVFAWNIHRSKLGRLLTAVMDSEVAAQAFGVQLAKYKTLAFSLSAFYAGIAGGLYAVIVGFITPYEFGLWPSLWTLTMVVIGGMGQLPGAVLGAVIITALPEILRGLKDYQELLYGVLLLATLIFKPSGLQGIFVDAREWVAARIGSKRV